MKDHATRDDNIISNSHIIPGKAPPQITIEVASDSICPWCFVADTRLNKVIAEAAPGMIIERKWLPFELNPHMPEEGKARKEYRSQKFGIFQN